MKTVIELDAYMQSRNYFYIRSQFHNNGDEYIREYMHKNGFENQGGVWINCF